MDLTLIPCHGQPAYDEKEIYRGEPKSGTTHFHACGTAVIVHKGQRYTIALMRVEYGEPLKDVVQRLLPIVRRRGLRIKFVLLDKAFFSVAVITCLKRARYGFLIPAVPRGRKPKDPRQVRGLRALQKRKNGRYTHTLVSHVGGKRRTADVAIGVASKDYRDKKTGKRRRKKLLYAVWKVRGTPHRSARRIASGSASKPATGK